MELCKVKKRYRLVAQHLRKSRADVHARRAEAELISVLTLGDRLETELVVTKHAARMARGRLTRTLELLAGLALGTFAARARVIEDLDALRPSLTADALGVDLRPVLTQLEDEFERLRLREEDLRARLAGLARIATDQFEQFLRAAHAGRLLTRLATDGDRR